MTLDKVKMVEHIRKYNPVCPVCEKAEWLLDDALVDIVYHNTNLSQGAVRALCTCSTCGYTLFLDPTIAGAIQE